MGLVCVGEGQVWGQRGERIGCWCVRRDALIFRWGWGFVGTGGDRGEGRKGVSLHWATRKKNLGKNKQADKGEAGGLGLARWWQYNECKAVRDNMCCVPCTLLVFVGQSLFLPSDNVPKHKLVWFGGVREG